VIGWSRRARRIQGFATSRGFYLALAAAAIVALVVVARGQSRVAVDTPRDVD
jgi:hypothetical protein